MSMGMSAERASRLAAVCRKEFDFRFFMIQDEIPYKPWYATRHLVAWFHSMPDSTQWHWLLSVMTLLAISLTAWDVNHPLYTNVFETLYNVLYGLHAGCICYLESSKPITRTCRNFCGYVLDILSYLHYLAEFLATADPASINEYQTVKVACYYLRTHRPIRFIWYMNDRNPVRSVVGTVIKYIYVFWLLRVTYAIVWLNLLQVQGRLSDILEETRQSSIKAGLEEHHINNTFFYGMYVVNKMFMPIGPQAFPHNDVERVVCMLIMITGTLSVTGIAVATMAIVLSVYLSPEENYRARLKLIKRDMDDTHVSAELRSKVETFYRMYWHKQRGVSGSDLLTTFPPTLTSVINSEIYFEAQQRSRVLRDLSSQFLSEISKVMTTTNYIPGDTIIKRNSTKSSVIYITYGDVEMLTAEDDVTPILRFSRGTVLNGCGVCPAMSCTRSHVEIRAATFCTAHVLRAVDLWKVISRFGKDNSHSFIILSAYEEHYANVMRHYAQRSHLFVRYKSSILQFKRNLIELKEARDFQGHQLLNRTDVFLDVAGCYVLRNISGSTLRDEGDEICLRSTFPCILQPQSSLQSFWEGFVASLVFIVTWTHPYFLVHVMNVGKPFRFFDYVVSVIFWLDIAAYLATGERIEEGVPITFKQTCAQQANSFWFALDVLSALPIFEFIGNGYFAGINKLLKLPKLFRVLRSMEEKAVYHANVLRFLAYTLLIIITSYLIGCMQQAFMCFTFQYCEVTSLSSPPFWSKTPLNSEKIVERVVFGLYWALSLMKFCSHKTAEWAVGVWQNRVFLMLLMEACMLLHVFIEALYSATIMVTITMKQDYEACIRDVKNFLIRNRVDPMLRQRFINYLQLCWHTDKAYAITHQRQSVLYDLPKHVSAELLAMQRSKYILCIPFMKYVNASQLTQISSEARLFYTSPNEILLSTGQISNEMYIIRQGMCEVINPITKKVVSIISTKTHFGVLECLLHIPSFYTVRAVTHVQVLSITNHNLSSVIQMPRFKDAIAYAKLTEEYVRLQEPRHAFIKFKPLPPAPNRSHFKLPRKYELDENFRLPFEQLGYLSVLRYVFPRWTIRPDGPYMQRYEWLRVFCALLGSVIFPCYTYMWLQFPILQYLYYILDYLAYFDICQRMLVGYFDEQGILVYHPASTAAHYLKGAFIMDLLASLPLENLDKERALTFERKPGQYRLLSTMQHFMFNRLLQLYRLPSAFNTLSAFIEREDILLIIKGIPLYCAMLNAMAASVVMESGNIYCTVDGADFEYVPMQDNFTWYLSLEKNIFRYNVSETPLNLHLSAFFWVVYETTTTGYNVFFPGNADVIKVLYAGFIIGSMLATYFSVRVISIRTNVNKALANFQENMTDISRYMRQEKLDPALQREVYKYYTHNWDKMGGIDYNSLLKLCDQFTLRTDAILHIYGGTFSKCPVLMQYDISLMRLIGRAVNSIYFLEGTRVIERDDVIDEIFIIDTGSVQVIDPDDDGYIEEVLQRGSMFGNLDDQPTLRCTNTFVAHTDIYLLKIRTEDYHRIVANFPSVKELMDHCRRKNKNYIVGRQETETSYISLGSYQEELSTSRQQVPDERVFKFLDAHYKIVNTYLISICLSVFYLDVYNATFHHNSTTVIVMQYLLDMAFFMKILVNLVLPYMNFRVKSERYCIVIAKRIYFEKVIVYDIFSILPLELLCFLWAPEKRWAAYAFLRLNRIFRVATINECLKRHNKKLHINLILSTLTSVAIYFSMFIHTTACVWYYVGVVADSQRANSSWMNPDSNVPPCQNYYICSLYFVLTTFTNDGVGDILPKVQFEVAFTCLLQIISTMLYMIYVGEFSNIIQYQSFRSFNYYINYVELQEYLKCNRVAKNLVAMVNKYALHLWRDTRGPQMPVFLETAPQGLHTKIMNAAYLHHLTSHPIFKKCELPFLRQLVRHFHLYTYSDGIYVVKESEITNAMYFVHKGTIEKRAEDIETTMRSFRADSFFETYQGLHRDAPYDFSYRADGNARVLTLCLDDWEYLLKHFPNSRDIIFEDIEQYRYDDDDYGPSVERRRVPLSKRSRIIGAVKDVKLRFAPVKKFLTMSDLPRAKPGDKPYAVKPSSSTDKRTELIGPPEPRVIPPDKERAIRDNISASSLSSRKTASYLKLAESYPMENRETDSVEETFFSAQGSINSPSISGSVKSVTVEQDKSIETRQGTQKLEGQEPKTDTNSLMSAVTSFLGELAPSFEKFLQSAVEHWATDTTSSTSQPADKSQLAVVPEYEEVESGEKDKFEKITENNANRKIGESEIKATIEEISEEQNRDDQRKTDSKVITDIIDDLINSVFETDDKYFIDQSGVPYDVDANTQNEYARGTENKPYSDDETTRRSFIDTNTLGANMDIKMIDKNGDSQADYSKHTNGHTHSDDTLVIKLSGHIGNVSNITIKAEQVEIKVLKDHIDDDDISVILSDAMYKNESPDNDQKDTEEKSEATNRKEDEQKVEKDDGQRNQDKSEEPQNSQQGDKPSSSK